MYFFSLSGNRISNVMTYIWHGNYLKEGGFTIQQVCQHNSVRTNISSNSHGSRIWEKRNTFCHWRPYWIFTPSNLIVFCISINGIMRNQRWFHCIFPSFINIFKKIIFLKIKCPLIRFHRKCRLLDSLKKELIVKKSFQVRGSIKST